MIQLEAALFVVTILVCLADLALLFAATLFASNPCNSYETKFKDYKRARIAIYALVLALQCSCTAVRVGYHYPRLTLLDACQLLVSTSYTITVAVLAVKWKHQLTLKLIGTFLVALLQPTALLALDVLVVSDEGHFDNEHIVRTGLHGLQLVLLTGLLITEVVIQQHQILQWGSFDGSYEPLLAEEAESPSGRKGPYRWQPGDGRLAMAWGAFHYVWPHTGVLRVRLLACFVLVLVERGINLAVPIMYKSMVETLSDTKGFIPNLLKGLWAATTAAAAGPAAAAHLSSISPAAETGAAAVAGLKPGLAPTGGAVACMGFGTVEAGGPGFLAGVRSLLAGGSLSADPCSAHDAALTAFWTIFYPWAFFYLGAVFLRGGSGSEGLLANVRDICWIPINQAAFRRISTDVFGHLLALDLNFHVHRKTGQIMRILDRGTSSIQDTVSIVLFNVLPQMVDIVMACSYLAARMQPWVAVIVLITVSSYVPLTVGITERRGKVRKVMNALDNERESRATDMLLNYETVKYFCNEEFELRGYDTATRQYQAAEYWQMAFLSLLSMVQSMVVWLGLAAGLVVCIWGVAKGELTVGDTVLFVTMMQQLYVPLTFFGSYYRQVQKALIDMENMFELLATVPGVRDVRGATPLQVHDGQVDFQKVVFGYSAAQPVLKGVSLTAVGGSTLAVVGSTGSGKSTILRLLLRFYDPQSGRILIDGQDIRYATQSSVRGAIAVVPQDTVLFNDTIMYNIRYGRPSSSNGEVFEAARVAHIHNHLAAFPLGYQTRVGERGLRLSGGEKQRVAFARAILKKPAILILDEATSALDSLTERLIQSSLSSMRGKCTSVVVAHRLSTIMDADQIVVLDKGRVAEFGSHARLIEAGGLYAKMWSRQLDSFQSRPELPYSVSGSVFEVLEEELQGSGNGAAGAVVAGGGGGRGALRKTESLQAYMMRRAETETRYDGELPSPSVTPWELSRQPSEAALEAIAEQNHGE